MHFPGRPAQDYGTYHVSSATPISAPMVAPNGDPMEIDYLGPPPAGPGNAGKRKRLSDAYGPRGKRARLNDPGPGANPDPNPNPPDDPAQPAPVPVAPQVDFVGVMDVGQGNCNVLVKGGEPLLYFDVGYPPHRMAASAPEGVHGGILPPPPVYGPITQNATNDLFVVLSHWDWDHYQLGAQWPLLKQRRWVVPAQVPGPVAAAFSAQLPLREIVPAGAPASFVLDAPPGVPTLTVFKCNPGNLPRAAVMNNSGLAIATSARLPSLGVNNRTVLLPADASLQSLPPVAAATLANVGALTAIHHGSRYYHAPDNLPAPAVAGQGRIAYSYGIMPAGGHTYNFPTQEALQKYHAAGWTTEFSTAQGGAITDGTNVNPYPLLGRGNIRIGAGAFNPAYVNTVFNAFPYALG